MAGALIIEGLYDDDLVKIYPDLKKTEKVMVFQEAAEVPSLESAPGSRGPARVVNGAQNPVIEMRPNKIQLWRFINAGVGNGWGGLKGSNFKGVTVKQTAQDGVQFSYENYMGQPLLDSSTNFSSGNRVDWLVQAPGMSGDYPLTDTAGAVLTLRVSGTALDPAPEFPAEKNYPQFPDYLKDIKDGDLTPVGMTAKDVSFDWNPNPPSPPPKPAARFMIDGKQFSENPADFIRVPLGQAQEWKMLNTTSIPHPFHIHVNPFQIVEIYDGKTTTPVPEGQRVWWDVRIIPPNGYLKIRSRFVDFWGAYVLHCHILIHEDRGMMKIVSVDDPANHLETATVHHH
jgi:FtsP/CotA-like multicopper oxidase with cupredoxin domain